VLVNCAGALHVSTVEGISEEDVGPDYDGHMKGPFLTLARRACEFRRRARSDREHWLDLGLIAMKDRAGVLCVERARDNADEGDGHDHAHENVRVNCICPSLVETSC